MKRESKAIHTKRLVIRLSGDLLEALKRRAKENEMSVSAYARMVLKRESEKRFDK